MARLALGAAVPPDPDLAGVGAGVAEPVPGGGFLAAGPAREDGPAARGVLERAAGHGVWCGVHHGYLFVSNICSNDGAAEAVRAGAHVRAWLAERQPRGGDRTGVDAACRAAGTGGRRPAREMLRSGGLQPVSPASLAIGRVGVADVAAGLGVGVSGCSAASRLAECGVSGVGGAVGDGLLDGGQLVAEAGQEGEVACRRRRGGRGCTGRCARCCGLRRRSWRARRR